MIWCVEDDENIREIEVYSLRSTGFEARGFAEGRSFFAALEKEKPDLILLDIQMSQKDGIETLREIRAMKDRWDIPVIMLTGMEEKDFVLASAKLGIRDYILKPFGSEELLKRIRRVFEQEEQSFVGLW